MKEREQDRAERDAARRELARIMGNNGLGELLAGALDLSGAVRDRDGRVGG